MKPLSIYIHIPFCIRKCAYCDFASWPCREADFGRYFDALNGEIARWSGDTEHGRLRERFSIETIFIGGGTPTAPPAEYIADVLRRCGEIAPVAPDAEITLEGNPGTLTPEKLETYRRAGVNRLSLGAQSFDDALLRSLGRIHTAAQIGEAVAMARAAGFDNLNLDLMYGLPGQTMARWLDTLDAATALAPQHLSAYSLIVEPGTPMAERVDSGAAVVPDDDAVNAMQRAAIDRLAEAGYRRYEISNYARPGFESRHNLTYWLRGDYLGLGCAAHSMLDDTRFHNPATLEAYLRREGPEEVERLNRLDRMEETLMLSTRLTRGLDLKRWRRDFGADLAGPGLDRLAQAGLISIVDDHLRLTRRGLELQNAVVLELCNILEA